MSLKSYVDIQIKNFKIGSQVGRSYRCLNNIVAPSFRNNRQDLLEVTFKNNSHSSKRLFQIAKEPRPKNIPETFIKSLKTELIGHRRRIPDNKGSSKQKSNNYILCFISQVALGLPSRRMCKRECVIRPPNNNNTAMPNVKIGNIILDSEKSPEIIIF